MANTLADIKAGIIEVCKAVPGIDPSQVYGYEPTSVDAPAVYVMLQDFEGSPLAINNFNLLLRFLVKWQDPEYAEAELDSFVENFLATWRGTNAAGQSARKLYGSISRGLGSLSSGTAGFVNISGITYRALDMTVGIYDKTGWI